MAHTDGRLLCSLLAGLALLAGCARLDEAARQRLATADYVVATNGNDAWSGKLAAPNAARTDGPLATLAGARDAVRRGRAGGALAQPVTVLVRDGVYRLSEPLTFTPEDSGSDTCPVTYAAYPGERPVISGGREITGWRFDAARVCWVVDIPEAKGRKWTFRRLYVNGDRRPLARTPNEGEFFRVQGKAAPLQDPKTGKETDSSKISFRFKPGDLGPQGGSDNLAGADVVTLRAWESGMLPVASVDWATNCVMLAGPMKWSIETGQRYYVENLAAALDAPGEWYLDREAGVLSYKPREGERLGEVSVVAPVLTQLLLIKGDPTAGLPVGNLHFEGLVFADSDYVLEPEGHSDWQAAVTVPAAIQANGARACSIERCEVRNIGNYAVWFERGCTDNRIVQNEIHELGAGGVRLGEQGVREKETEQTSRNTISNNFIHDGGSVFYGAHGVWVGQSSDNIITHNEICDFNYTGLSVGWSWGYSPTTCHRNLIEYNHLHHLGRGMLCDMAAIYTLGISTGTKIRYNLIHDIWDWVEGYGAGGIYPDEGSSGILIENNVVYRTTAGGLTIHYGKDILARNNILAFGREQQVYLGRSDKDSNQTFERNIVYYDQGRLFSRMSTLVADNNVYFDASGEEVRFPGDLDLAAWQAKGYDQHSVIADPLFVDPQHGDFRFRPGSPALTLGFQPIDISQAGLTGAKAWTDRPKRLTYTYTGIPSKIEAPPLQLDDGFELSLVGAGPESAYISGETKGAAIRVTDEMAAPGGKRSLKFLDAPGLDQIWNPHMYYTPHDRRGVVRESFDLRLEQGAIVWHEWRTGGSDYFVGPSLRISADGKLKAGDQELLTLPIGQWVRFELACTIGKQATGRYSLAITVPGQPPKEWNDLACHPRFKAIEWVGFVSNATEKAVFYLDNIRLACTDK
ncbi:MAG: hypothetical protein A3K19_01755 [Lentisphaerae bacterium RIFOXYB12_FULL_65_16]|nr:MAG: hypothetical protein A3K18_02400 [Lentisphaerae bacterium RIFOXYA12_64_32]OGV92710.1 MAG: hypothetical protein A3K19_01755 [Lentisphaerae bacterium RIFOXYB12_FULL_65_16]